MISVVPKNNASERVRELPAPDLFAACPYDGRILEFYKRQFECVFVLLHPFIKPLSIDPKFFYPGTYPSKTDILANCVAVRWTEAITLSSLVDVNQLDIGLRTAIGGLKAEFSNSDYAGEIDRLEVAQRLIRPSEGEVPELIQNDFFEAVQSLGEDWLWVGDEFCSERKLEWIDDLKGNYQLPSHGNLFLPNKKLLLTTHWDSHFSFVCSDRTTILALLKFFPFEGFFCDENTEVYWSVQSPISNDRIVDTT